MNTNPVPEWITRAQADGLMILVLLVGILLAVGAFVTARNRGTNARRAALLYGGPPTLAGLLWHLYNFITNQFGLSSVTGLLVNLMVFVAVGVGVGLLAQSKSFRES